MFVSIVRKEESIQAFFSAFETLVTDVCTVAYLSEVRQSRRRRVPDVGGGEGSVAAGGMTQVFFRIRCGLRPAYDESGVRDEDHGRIM